MQDVGVVYVNENAYLCSRKTTETAETKKSQQSAWNFQFNSLSYSTPAKSKTTPIFNPDETNSKHNSRYISPFTN